MAEFQEVMKQWRRRCEACEKNERVECYIKGYVCEAFCKMQKHIDPEFVEQDVMSWAAEHPEPVYPTWYEFMRENKIIPDVLEDCGDYYKTIGKWLVKSTIKHDIAQKLGIEPKEVT